MSQRKGRAEEEEGWVDPAAAERGLLLPPMPADLAEAPARLAAALAGGRVIGLVVDPLSPSAAAQIRACRERGVASILLGDAARARSMGADGAELDDIRAVAAAREAHASELLIGAVCGNSRHLAMEAGEAGADYVAFGRAGADEVLALVAWWVELFVLPCAAACASVEQAEALLRAGVDFLVPDPGFWTASAGVEAGLGPYRAALAAAGPLPERQAGTPLS